MRHLVCLGIALAAGCAPDEETNTDVGCDPFAVDVVSFSPGEAAGFGAEAMPEIIQGPPQGGGPGFQSTDVVSLGVGGRIVLELACPVENGEGVDLVVYENAFAVHRSDENGNAIELGNYVEPARVAVSDDGDVFVGWPCTPTLPPSGIADDDGVDGCAGMATVAEGASLAGVFPDGGGDGFDLDTVGLEQARFVEIVDVSTTGSGVSAGFDLDSIAVRVR
jgi:hypothetical protein